MEIFTTYKVKIKHYNHVFKDTVAVYRKAVDFLIEVCLQEWDNICSIHGALQQKMYIEHICHATKKYPTPKYNFDELFYKFPSYLLRGAIAEAFGKVSSYKSNLSNWKIAPDGNKGKEPSEPKAGYIYPALYRENMYIQSPLDEYKAQIKVYVNNTWDFISVNLRKSDMDYINRHCKDRKKCVPTLRKRGRQWFLDFPFKEKVNLPDTDVYERTIASVDLGINTAATVSVMRSDGTILGRHFLKLPKETDSLTHAVNRIKKAQQHGNFKTPRLWAKSKGINHDIAVKTAQFIVNVAVLYNVDVIVFEHLDLNRRIRGSKKQRLHLWKARCVQKMVADKAHRLCIRISRINAWKTSKLAYDGSGEVLRGKHGGFSTYELCRFKNGKIYNCDLSASYNIGARYFIRELLKSEPKRVRLQLEAKVPQVCKRSTCTLSTLISLNAVLAA